MPAFDSGPAYVDGQLASAEVFNDKWDLLEEFLNVTKLDGDNLQLDIITPDMLTDALRELLGISGGGDTRRGKSIITDEGSRTNTAYGQLDNGPDQVSGLVVPEGGEIEVRFQALMKSTVGGAARAAIFIGNNQLKVQGVGPAPNTQAAYQGTGGITGTYRPLFTVPYGLQSADRESSSDVTTGQAQGQALAQSITIPIELDGTTYEPSGVVMGGGVCTIDNLPAGTYDISIRFKALSGSVLAKERRLKAKVVGY